VIPVNAIPTLEHIGAKKLDRTSNEINKRIIDNNKIITYYFVHNQQLNAKNRSNLRIVYN